MRVRVDLVDSDVPELGVFSERESVLVEHPDLHELPVHEERDVSCHRVYAVLDDRPALAGLAAVDVVDVHRVGLVEERL
jgi:hypothetical protein